MNSLFDFEYYAELGEIIKNVFMAVLRGDVTPEDATEYLKAINEERQAA